MTDAQLLLAQQKREERIFDVWFDENIEILFSEADTVGPVARHKLKGILKHYAREAHPFRACVRDNMKRFGPGRTEAVCATLKDIIRGTTHWRGHPELDHGSPGAIAASNVQIDEEVEKLLLSIPDEKLEQFVQLSEKVWQVS